MKRDEMVKAIEDVFKDRMDQIMVAIRASHPSAQDIKDLAVKLDNHIVTHERDNREINDKLDPVYSAFQKASGFKATVLLIATTLGSIWAIIEGGKKIIGK